VLAGGVVGDGLVGSDDRGKVVEGRGDTTVEGAKLAAGVGGAAVRLAVDGAGVCPAVVGDRDVANCVAWGIFRGSKSSLIVPAGRIALEGVGEGAREAGDGVGCVPKIVVGTGAAEVGRGVTAVGRAVTRGCPKVVSVKSPLLRVVAGAAVVGPAPNGAALSFRLSSPWPGMFWCSSVWKVPDLGSNTSWLWNWGPVAGCC
jgi:hypothetical protein